MLLLFIQLLPICIPPALLLLASTCLGTFFLLVISLCTVILLTIFPLAQLLHTVYISFLPPLLFWEPFSFQVYYLLKLLSSLLIKVLVVPFALATYALLLFPCHILRARWGFSVWSPCAKASPSM